MDIQDLTNLCSKAPSSSPIVQGAALAYYILSYIPFV